MNEKKDQARQIVFNYYLSGALFALFSYLIFSKNKEVDKENKREFEHHLLGILLEKSENDPDHIIQLYKKEELTWWIRAAIRNQLWNIHSNWNRWNNDKRMMLCGSFEQIIDVINDEQSNKNGEPIIWLEL